MNPLKRELQGTYVLIKGDKPEPERVVLCQSGEGCKSLRLGTEIVGEFPCDKSQILFSSEEIERGASPTLVAEAFMAHATREKSPPENVPEELDSRYS